MTEEDYILQWNDHKYNFFSLAADDLFRSEELTDVTVCCGDQLFDAHKLILSVCSPYFRTMLGRAKHQHPIVFLKDVKAADFERLLHFMYYGEVRIPNSELESLILTAKSLRIKGLATSTHHTLLDDHHRTQGQGQAKQQDQPENYTVNNNRSPCSTPPAPVSAPPPNPAPKKEQNPTPPKKRRISASTLQGEPPVNDENARVGDTQTQQTIRKEDMHHKDDVRRKALTPPATLASLAVTDKDSPPIPSRPPSSTSTVTDRIIRHHQVSSSRSRDSHSDVINPMVQLKEEAVSPPPQNEMVTLVNEMIVNAAANAAAVAAAAASHHHPSARLALTASRALTESTRILPPTEPRQNGTCYFCKKAFMKNKQLMNHVCPKKPKPSK